MGNSVSVVVLMLTTVVLECQTIKVCVGITCIACAVRLSQAVWTKIA